MSDRAATAGGGALESLSIAVLEPYYGGSHAAFVDTLARHTRHNLTLATLPARKWKWRMRGASAWFARDGFDWSPKGGPDHIDLILTCDMLSVADLRALLPHHLRNLPIVCYFHENQLTYPISDDQTRDFQYGMTNITSCLASDAVWFNSQFHLDDFLGASADLLRKMPDFVPQQAGAEIRGKAKVLYPPVNVESGQSTSGGGRNGRTILWPHRWEFDKNPEPFFEALLRLDDAGYEFDLVLLGEQFRTAPPVFASAWQRLQPHITHAGYLPSRDDYLAMLGRCDLVVSTAIQENFGIAVIEAILAGCQPLLPNRLAYPEIIPEQHHAQCLYPNDTGLFKVLRDWLNGRNRMTPEAMTALTTSLDARFGPDQAVSELDDALGAVWEASRAMIGR